jgi:hypothetical protein
MLGHPNEVLSADRPEQSATSGFEVRARHLARRRPKELLMVAANDAELVRVFTRRVGGAVGDVSFPSNADFQVVVEAEAGSALHGSGAQFLTNIVVRDITDNVNIASAPAVGFSGSMGGADWPNLDATFVFTVAAADLGAAKENDVCQVVAFVKAGVVNPDTTFALSPYFMITAP